MQITIVFPTIQSGGLQMT